MLRPYIPQRPNVPQHDVRVSRHRLSEDRALAVARAVGAGPGRRLEVVDEPAHYATVHQGRHARGHALVVHGAGGGATGAQRIVGERESAVEHLLADAGGQRRDALQHRLAGERLSDGEQQCGEAERREDHGQRPFRRGHHPERVLEPPVDRADQGGERVVGGQVGPFVGVADRQHVVARDAPQLVRPTVGPAARALEQPLDHAAAPEGTSPPTSASSMRTCGAPSVTGRGACPPLPQPPPIWFQRKSPAMKSIRSSVWNRLPASTTSFTSSARCPSRIMRPYAAVKEKFSSSVWPPKAPQAYTPSFTSRIRSSKLPRPFAM